MCIIKVIWNHQGLVHQQSGNLSQSGLSVLTCQLLKEMKIVAMIWFLLEY